MLFWWYEMAAKYIHWLDLLIIGLGFTVMFYLGIRGAQKTKSADDYFTAGRKMPGWILGFSILATMVSSIGFLAVPGFSYEYNWRFMAQYISFLGPLIVAVVFFIPFYRASRFNTAFEYLEYRYGTWARLYVSGCLVVQAIFFMSNVIYTISLPIRVLTGWPVGLIIIVFGIIISFYTIAGGLQAVIWTDLLQAIALWGGAILILPVICYKLPGGFMQILQEAWHDGKMSMGTMAFTGERGFWSVFLAGITGYLVIYGTNQNYIQRYNAAKNLKEAYKGAVMGALMYFPIMVYFLFLGTSLYVFYKQFPSESVNLLDANEVLPYFILSEIPMGLSGFVVIGLLAAAMSTLDSYINAFASVINNDFYRRLCVKEHDERHYLRVGRIFSLILSGCMIIGGILIHTFRTGALLDLFHIFGIVSLPALTSLFLLGFVTTRVNSKMIAIGIVCSITFVICFLIIQSQTFGEAYFPGIRQALPDIFWLGLIVDTLMILIVYVGSLIFGLRSEKDLTNLTIWTMEKGWRKRA